jgi:DNA-binding MarR family transcriptional regulator
MLSCILMLETAPRSPATDAAIQRYLHDTLGLAVHLRPWPGAGKLPYFLQEVFHTRELQLHGHTVLLAQDLRPQAPKLGDLRAQLDKLRTAAQLPVIYVTNALASYERKRLVEQRVPFLVPGNQLYLPDLGIDLREYFRHPNTPTGDALSPATQAVLITMLLTKPWRDDWSPAEIVTRLGYTPMTLTRVVRELTDAGLAKVKRHGRERHIHTDELPQQLWDRARQQMRSPVKRSVWVQTTSHIAGNTRLAGLSALARLTQLADPPWPISAIGQTEWRNAKQGGIKLLMEPAMDCSEWQLWSYSPDLLPDASTVDPLSLTLSLEHGADERVQMALDELRGQFPW